MSTMAGIFFSRSDLKSDPFAVPLRKRAKRLNNKLKLNYKMVLDKLRQFLIELKYPNIKGMTYDQFAEIFLPENMFFFVQWYVEELELSDEYTEDYSNKELADILCKFGFCKSVEKNDFMTGQLDPIVQLQILQRMLAYLKIIKNPKKPNPLESILLDDEIGEFVHSKVDLFPKFIGKKEYTKEECNALVNSLRENITASEEEIANLELQLGSVLVPDIEEELSSINVTNAIQNFTMNEAKIVHLRNSGINMSGNENTVVISNEFPGRLEECWKLAHDFHQFSKDLQYIQDFNSFNNLIKIKEEHEGREIISTVLKLTEDW